MVLFKNQKENKLQTIMLSADQEWEKFLKTLPGGDYYGLFKSMKIWRKDKLTPSQLLKKYSK